MTPTKPLPTIPPEKAKIVGLFGLSGHGTASLLDQVRKKIGEGEFAFCDGNQALAAATPGGLMVYNAFGDDKRPKYRDMALTGFEKECVRKDMIGVVTRFLALWSEELHCYSVTPIADLQEHTHILYMAMPYGCYSGYQAGIFQDEEVRANLKRWHGWQKGEISYLRHFCQANDITFTVLTPHLGAVPKVSSLIRDFRVLTEWQNRRYAEEQLMRIMSTPRAKTVETVLLFDADGTLSPHDSEHLIWRQVPDDLMPLGLQQTPSKEAYGQLGSTYKDHLQTVLLHEEIFEDETFAAVCQQAAAAIRLYPDMLALLHRALNTPHTLPIILTGGSRLVWENVLKMVGLSGAVGVIGGGRHEDRAIMTPDVKGWLITLLQERCKANVWAFGSGEVDSIMLMKANQAVLITDSERWLTENVKPDWKDVLDLICPQLHDIILATNAPMALQYRPHEMRMLGRKLVREIFTRRLPTVFEE
jgi:phosphoglycolate phosphatase-like HAD superfamily hydrolase